MSKVDKFSPYHDGSMQFDIDGGWVSYDDYKESADRIEELEAKLAKEIEISNNRGNHIEFVLLPQMAGLEAKLAKAMQVVEMIASADVDAVLGQAVDISCEIIGELMEDEDNE